MLQQPLTRIDSGEPLRFDSVDAAVLALKPCEPLYCVFPELIERSARRFVGGFPGQVLFAVKSNPDPLAIRSLYRGGVRHFDVASLSEIELIGGMFEDAAQYYMAPVKAREAVRKAFENHGVRQFVIDHANELDKVLSETNPEEVVIFVRLAVQTPDAIYDFSSKFGATPEETIDLLRAVRDRGAEPALAFNLGSMVMTPSAYADTLRLAGDLLRESGVAVRRLDLGGGFPSSYYNLDAPPFEAYFTAISEALASVPLGENAVVMAEPGRALVAEGMTLVARVLLRKEDRIFLNDGIYGALGEPLISRGQVEYPNRIIREDQSPASEQRRPFKLYGPTCDSLDALPEPFDLPEDIREGDWVEFGRMGAYTVSTRTDFNGFFASNTVEITDPNARPPGVE